MAQNFLKIKVIRKPLYNSQALSRCSLLEVQMNDIILFLSDLLSLTELGLCLSVSATNDQLIITVVLGPFALSKINIID